MSRVKYHPGYCVGRILLALLTVVALAPGMVLAQGAGVEVKEAPAPRGLNVFDLNLAQTKAFSRSKNFQVLGHSYFKGPWLLPDAQASGLGTGLNQLRVHNGIAYMATYSSPAISFGILIADVSNPADMKPLSFIPCMPGTRCTYVGVNYDRQILVVGHSRNAANPNKPPAGQPTDSGWDFWNVADPSHPALLSHLHTLNNGTTHEFELDDRYVYACGQSVAGTVGDEFEIFDYQDPTSPHLISSFHIQGQRPGELADPADETNPNGTAQHLSCHAIEYHKDRVYVAYRDAGLVVLDVSDRTAPKQIARYDYVPPFNGDGFGAAHTPALVLPDPDAHPNLLVMSDEIFDCPPGFGRVMDISDIQSPDVAAGKRDPSIQVLSSYRLPFVNDVFDFNTGQFVCRPGTQTAYVPKFDYRSPSLFYQSWYDQGLRAWDISNPYLPREVGYYLSPKYASPGRVDRQTRESYQDPDTGLIYLPDGSGGGLTVLRWTGPIPRKPPLPGAR